MKYQFRQDSRFNGANASEVGLFLEKHFPNQRPDPKKMVELAKSPRSPLHKYFDWDDSTAARKWRVHQARMMISCLYVEVDAGSPIRAYENVYIQADKSNSYLSTQKIGESQDLYEQVLETAIREISYWKLKYQSYKNYFGGVFAAIEDVNLKGVKHGKEKTSRRVNKDTCDRNKGSKNYANR